MPSDPSRAPALRASETTPDRSDEFACFTGDCDHGTQAECDAAIRAEYTAQANNIDRLRAALVPPKANTIPRRIDMRQWTPAERAIHDAVDVVEDAGTHPLLTDAVVLLGQARDKVADFVDLQPKRPPVNAWHKPSLEDPQ